MQRCKRVFQALIHQSITELCEIGDSLIAPVRMGVARPSSPFPLFNSHADAIQVSMMSKTGNDIVVKEKKYFSEMVIMYGNRLRGCLDQELYPIVDEKLAEIFRFQTHMHGWEQILKLTLDSKFPVFSIRETYRVILPPCSSPKKHRGLIAISEHDVFIKAVHNSVMRYPSTLPGSQANTRIFGRHVFL